MFVEAATGVYVKSFMAEFLQARLAASLAANPIVTASPPAQFFTIILAWITGILGIVTLIYGIGAEVVALGAPAAAVVAGGAMASAVNDIASNPIGMPRGSCSPPAGMSPDTLVGTTGSLLGASGDSAATQLQADLQANGVELPTDIGTFPAFVPMLKIDPGAARGGETSSRDFGGEVGQHRHRRPFFGGSQG
ncbi:hypothetical protein EMIHUDRAFT_232913 [Emiliania huxleyi CCMP1516]|uniref:H(+)-exporting diphosphatase n=2 Tax=Emiliania huxleyi TaxID=2903 RepID=A0A0D3K3R2_EMIH1|nr:hypothetical protein EMIHUDRAFT_232913 [Emiliania huxleyi CCMP1516]EOD30397.1 hypothetical protein EMIHUDRAFT_232913 [Emiliania huxleyi CCMP1516]|eukprot:XP_005782826.1 hypothetical protein EMIHUDRAFT_232913 [Emiliania huxleyi CCMP1516]